jgi:Fe-S cluster assembly protein SufD
MHVDVRTVKTSAEQALADAFAGARTRLPGVGAIAALREDAFKRFERLGLPHRRIEQWKYTDLRALLREAKPLATVPDNAARKRAKTAGALFAGIDCRRLVFVDGAFAPELSDLVPEPGLAIGTMAEALAKGDPLVLAHLGKTIETPDVAVALNTALMGDGAVVRVAAGATIVRPIHLVFCGAQPALVFIHSLVVVEHGASVCLLESHETGESQVNTALELVADDDTRVDHFKVIAARGLHLSTLMASVGARAKFNSFALTANSDIVRNQMFIRYAGERSESAIGGVSLLRGKEHADTTLVIDHASVGCVSRERFRSVLDGESRGVFQGKITVQPHAQKTDAKMSSNALLLSELAEADNKPELEIFADDVQCGHGATAGALQEDLLFYLRARGIPYKEAEALLVQAFIGETIETIAHDGIREALMNAAMAWLKERA